MNRSLLSLFSAVLCSTPALAASQGGEEPSPNIVYILADDLGYGDVHCLNPDRGREHPEVVMRLTQLLQKHIADGRSTPGAKQPNDATINLERLRR